MKVLIVFAHHEAKSFNAALLARSGPKIASQIP